MRSGFTVITSMRSIWLSLLGANSKFTGAPQAGCRFNCLGITRAAKIPMRLRSTQKAPADLGSPFPLNAKALNRLWSCLLNGGARVLRLPISGLRRAAARIC